ncbi:MAG: Exodeoxyribonuclease 7 small subunit [uncultured bacterium]|nr:MAG: Exodeoxyribonuclease 7 small subunit [uncultured bacterium]OGT34400.1 MAG: exodeoxyribonuclease VII small subunit [Gammaproteobacteria bacterium RIFCSPHIGHO2_02_FULL_39_13]OGT50492.1 MAG: exodeoxyribonuclease VII small subunit [Gammaproteobacteria bacterium RIFCSPHIGHO2_12_FULL_39_24]
MSTSRKKEKTNIVTTVDFEKSLRQLNQLIEKMESDQLTLEASLRSFEEGITLIRQCQQVLVDAEQKVQILTEKTGKPSLDGFHHDD